MGKWDEVCIHLLRTGTRQQWVPAVKRAGAETLMPEYFLVAQDLSQCSLGIGHRRFNCSDS